MFHLTKKCCHNHVVPPKLLQSLASLQIRPAMVQDSYSNFTMIDAEVRTALSFSGKGKNAIKRYKWMTSGKASTSRTEWNTSGSDAVQYILNHASVQVIFCVPQTLSMARKLWLSECSQRAERSWLSERKPWP